ncbi:MULTISPECIES: hypothetical protein [Bacillus cereus group]|uniref:hypothetical protein n=1 Tax=Bacillus cereus group TaxID=86661 RepID=UPI001F35CDD0|nr:MULTISPECIES: hypothetical protein [Bacillus cereus group]MCU5474072.1 hypothetical protein [Bacillus paranthracis]BCC80252.1 hypothetical protein BCJMU62_p42 [Bacillus cereus]
MMMNLLSLQQEANGLIQDLNGKDISLMSLRQKASYSNRIVKVRMSLEAYRNTPGVNELTNALDYLRVKLAEVPQQETRQQANGKRAEVIQNGLKETPYAIPQSFYTVFGQNGQR